MKRGTSPMRESAGGFTLLETAIAVTLMAMMAVGLWSVFRVSLASWRRGTESIDANQRHRSIVDLMKRQMSSIYGVFILADPRTGTPGYPVFSGTETGVQFVSLNSLRFYEHPGLTFVAYELERDRSGAYRLVQREARYLGLDPAVVNPLEGEGVEPLPVFENLTSFAFEYYDPGAADRPARWVSQWNPREMQQLPAAISLSMVSQAPGGETILRHLVVPIMARPDNQLNVPFQNPFEQRPRRFREDDERARQ